MLMKMFQKNCQIRAAMKKNMGNVQVYVSESQ